MSLYEVTNNPREFIGANNPPQTVAEMMAAEHADIFATVDTIEAKVASLPKKIVSDLQDARVAEIGVECGDLIRKLNETRKSETDPLYKKQKDIIACFAVFVARAEAALKAATDLATAYKLEKAATARREQELAAQRAEEEARRQRELAEKAQGEGKIGKALLHDDRAEAAADTAFRAGIAAQASSADLTRVRAASGAMSTTKGKWTYAIENWDAIPLDRLRPFFGTDAIETALAKFARETKGRSELPGVRVYLDEKASFRR